MNDVFPIDEEDGRSPEDEPAELGSVCLSCGGDGRGGEGCGHGTIARFHSTTRPAEEAVRRLRRAALEHRAAERALRALVLTEVGRERASLIEVAEAPPAAPIESESPASEPAPAPLETACPRCAEREGEAIPAPAARAARKKAAAPAGQQAFPFGPTDR